MDAKDIKQTAIECADEAKDVAGSSPFNTDGSCLLPDEPPAGDWDALIDGLGREPTDAEAADFADAYIERMDYHRDGWDRILRMKAVRDALGMDQATFAEFCGVSGQQRVSEWECGVRYPSAQSVELAELKGGA